MSRTGVYIIAGAVTSIMAVAPLRSCAQPSEQEQESIPPVPLTSPAKKEDDERDDDMRIVIFEKPQVKMVLPNEWRPAEVINITETEPGPHKGDWVIEIQNVSDRPIKAMELTLAPPNCEAYVMSEGLWVGFDADDPKLSRPILQPGETDKLIVKYKDLAEVMPIKGLKGCPPDNSYYYLALEIVTYADGTKWRIKHDPEDPNWKDR